MSGEPPLVSVLLPTRDRPDFIALALAYYQYQTYTRRELFVIDDGDRYPVDAAAVAAVGGKLLRVASGTTVGEKLNLALREATGPLCQIMDDDDFYAPNFLAAMVKARSASTGVVCYPSFAGVAPYLRLNLRRWEMRRTTSWHLAGGTLHFAREDWLAHPFRRVMGSADYWFIRDHARLGAQPCPVGLLEIFVQMRHQGGAGNRGHAWAMQAPGLTVEASSLALPLYGKEPEALLPEWSLAAYRRIRLASYEEGAEPGSASIP